jgi:hypothetical protein
MKLTFRLIKIVFLSMILATPANGDEDAKKKLTELKELYESKLISKEVYDQKCSEALGGAGSPNSNPKPPEPSFACNYSGKDYKLPSVSEFKFGENADVSTMVREIIDEMGLSPNFIVQSAPVDNAMAMNQGPNRLIVYNPNFIAQLKGGDTNWTIYSVIAHEIGHHLCGHTLQGGGSRPPTELEADEFSGAILQRLGATLENAQLAMNRFGTDYDTPTHPAKLKRLEAIKRGWTKSASKKTKITENITIPVKPDPVVAKNQPLPSDILQKKPCVHEIPCAHLVPCTHQAACLHQGPCTHQIPCQHQAPCQHPMPCQHFVPTPYGPRPMHGADAMHPFDTAHAFDLLHAYDAMHPYDIAHPNGDPVHKCDYRHPEGD